MHNPIPVIMVPLFMGSLSNDRNGRSKRLTVNRRDNHIYLIYSSLSKVTFGEHLQDTVFQRENSFLQIMIELCSKSSNVFSEIHIQEPGKLTKQYPYLPMTTAVSGSAG